MSLTEWFFCVTIEKHLIKGVLMIYRMGKTWPDTLLTLPESVLDHIDKAGEAEIRLLLHFAKLLKAGALSEEDILLALEDAFSSEEIRLALAFWRGCGVLGTDKAKKTSPKKEPIRERTEDEESTKKSIDADEAPFYSSKDLADAAQREPNFKNLVAFAEDRLEKVMNTSELARLYSFLDYLKMPLDVVMLVIEDCVSREKKSLRYITKMLTSFQDDGIDTYQKAEAWFAARQESVRYAKIIRSLFGLGDRKLTSAEEEILKTWRTVYRYEEEILTAAYEKTVSSAKTPSIKYMHKILEGWHRDGVQTIEDIGKAGSGKKADKSYDLDDFFQQAVSRGRKEL